jgi:hypothetical protein
MHDLPAKHPAAQLTPCANACAYFELLLLRGIKVKEAQLASVCAVVQDRNQLPARAIRDFATRDFAFNLSRIAIKRIF